MCRFLFLHFLPLYESVIPASSRWNTKEGKKWDEVSTGCNRLSPQNFTQRLEESGLTLYCISTPTGPSCSGPVRLPSACLPGLHAGICRSCHGWRGDHAPAAPERSPQGPPRLSTPARSCSRTRSGHPPLRGRHTKSETCGYTLTGDAKASVSFFFFLHCGNTDLFQYWEHKKTTDGARINLATC